MIMNRYIFYVKLNISQDYSSVIPDLDAFYKIQTPELDEITFKVAQKINPKLGEDDRNTFLSMNLRSRYAMTEGPFLVKTEFELNREELQMVLESKQLSGELESFLNDAKV
jgi:hypothetical protein